MAKHADSKFRAYIARMLHKVLNAWRSRFKLAIVILVKLSNKKSLVAMLLYTNTN